MAETFADPPPVVLRLPFRGTWMALNSPADRVPSHGSDLFGTTYAIDFVAVDERGRTGPVDWRTLIASEPPERFRAFDHPVLAPVAGTIVVTHDGEPDHVARRSIPAAIPYLLGQARRARAGVAAIAGNHVVIAREGSGPCILLAHLRCGSVRGAVGDRVDAGDEVGRCGNSGNSTQPHVHVQATDSTDWATTRGLPIAFTGAVGMPHAWVPPNGQAFEAAA